MAELSDYVTGLDRLLHESARLVIMTALQSCRMADFRYLQKLTGLTKGNLSRHLSKLEEAGLVKIEKGFVGKVPNTVVSPTTEGQMAIRRHWERLDAMRDAASQLPNLWRRRD